MNIAAFQYNLDERAFEIYVSGCSVHCRGCHNPELWDFDFGTEFTTAYAEKIISMIADFRKDYEGMIKKIHLLGGEPLDSSSDAFYLARKLKENFSDVSLILFTGHDFDKIPKEAFDIFDSIKFGKFDDTKKSEEGAYLASTNQGWWNK